MAERKEYEGIDSRHPKALALSEEKRKAKIQQDSTQPSQEQHRETALKSETNTRRGKERTGFFCPVKVFSEDTTNNTCASIDGIILNISSTGAAIVVGSEIDWLNRCNHIKVEWGASRFLSGKVVWKKYESNYLNMGKMTLLGISLKKSSNGRAYDDTSFLKQCRNLKRINSIKDLTDIEFYPLYIGGNDIDTGIYGFAASAERFIEKPFETTRILEFLSKGLKPERYLESIYAAYSIASDADVDQAIDAAFQAWQEFRYTTIRQRKRLFLDIYDNLGSHRKDLIDLMVREGHPLRLAEWEYAGMVKAFEPKTIKFYLNQLFKNLGIDDGENLYLTRRPDGVVCVLPPGNAPCPNSFIAAFAMLAGNSLIIKPPLRNPVSTLYLWKKVIVEALQANKIQPGVVNLIIGDSETILNRWLASPKVSDIFYFGNSRSGLEIGSRVYANGKKPILELSGNDTMVVWKDADLERAATSLAEGFLGSMQICMVARRAIIHPAVYDKFKSIMLDKVKTIRAGLPHEEKSCLAPVGKIEQFYQFLIDALKQGANLIYGGTRIGHLENPDPHGVFVIPAIIGIQQISKAEKMKCTTEEGFFPLLALIKAAESHGNESDETVFCRTVTFLEKNMYGLRISVWAKSPRYTRKFIKYIHNCGLLRINASHNGFSALLGTHGGPGRSGGPLGELNYIWEKTSHLQGICLKKSDRPLEQ